MLVTLDGIQCQACAVLQGAQRLWSLPRTAPGSCAHVKLNTLNLRSVPSPAPPPPHPAMPCVRAHPCQKPHGHTRLSQAHAPGGSPAQPIMAPWYYCYYYLLAWLGCCCCCYSYRRPKKPLGAWSTQVGGARG